MTLDRGPRPGRNRLPRALILPMRDNLETRERALMGFARAALERAQMILARAEAGGDPRTVEKWRGVVTSLELEAAREIVAEMRRVA